MKAEIKKGSKGFYFRLLSDNGRVLNHQYNSKQSVKEVLAKYFPQFPVVDKTED